MDIPMPARGVLSKIVFLLMALFLPLLSGCLDMESSKTLAEEEDLRVRGKNVTQTRKQLEEKVRRELDHIRILQNTLELTLTKEEALTEEIKKEKTLLGATRKDNDALKGEVAKSKGEMAKSLKEQQQLAAKAGEIGDSIAALKKRIAAMEEVLKEESRKVEETWLRVSAARKELEGLKKEETRLDGEITAARELLWKREDLLKEAESSLSGSRKALEEMKKKIEDLLGGGP